MVDGRADRAARTSPARRFARCALPTTGVLLGIIAWQLASEFLVDEASALPAPLDVAKALGTMWRTGELQADCAASLRRILIGFLLAFSTALFLGLLAVRMRRLFRGVEGIMSIVSSIPPIAWTPIAILWFGIGDAPAYFIIFLGAFFPMFAGVYAGVSHVSENLTDAGRTLGASRWMIAREIIIPAAIPEAFTGIKTGIAVAWFNVIAAELIGVPSGLGYRIQLNRTLLLSENVIAVMLIIGMIGLLMRGCVSVVGKLLAPWSLPESERATWLRRRRHLRHALRGFRLSPRPYVESRVTPASNEHTRTQHTPPDASPVLEVEGLGHSYPGQQSNTRRRVLTDVSFVVRRGEAVAIVGPNGCGKTTVLRSIAGLIQPDRGTISFNSEPVISPSCERAMIFQSLSLFHWKTCNGNVDFALRASSQARHSALAPETRRTAANRALGDVGLADVTGFYPCELSGGMQHRLAVARAFVVDPALVLMDEPFAAFDPLMREESQRFVVRALEERETTVLLVTHDIDEAVFMADRVLVLGGRPASVKTEIAIPLQRPRTASIRGTSEFQSLRAILWRALQDGPGEIERTARPTVVAEETTL